jgi:hypothetical protein
MRSKKTERDYARKLLCMENGGINYKEISDIDEYISKLKTKKTKNGKTLAIGTVKSYLISTQWYLKEHNGKKEYQLAISKEIERISIDQTAKTSKNILMGTQIENYLEWDKITAEYKLLISGYKKNATIYKTYVLLSCYILLCPRRLLDFALMYVGSKDTILDPSKNYYIKGCKYFVFSNYKTQKNYKTQYIGICDKLAIILDEYIDKYNITGSLFGMTTNAISMKLRRFFHSRTGKNVSVNILRHSFISWATDTGLINKHRSLIANLMSHSIPMQLEYYKLLEKEEELNDMYYSNNKTIIRMPVSMESI